MDVPEFPLWVLDDEDVATLKAGGEVRRIYRGNYPRGVVPVIRRNAPFGASHDLLAQTSHTTRQYGKGQKRPRYEREVIFVMVRKAVDGVES